jgi:hypothetical protein
MPSKKKSSSSRNKARKGGMKAEEQQETPDMQMERLKIDDNFQADEDTLLEEAIKLAAAEKEELDAAAVEQKEQDKKVAAKHVNECQHGYIPTEDLFLISDFAEAHFDGYYSVGAGAMFGECSDAAHRATFEKYHEVWHDPSKMKQVASYFIFLGTQGVLDGNITNARTFASMACYLRDNMAVFLQETKATLDPTKVIELKHGDEHTLSSI